MTLDQHRRAEGDPEPAYVGDKSMFIGGTWVEASSGGRLVSIDPTTERPLGSFPDATAADVDTAVAVAREASAQWRDYGCQRRARLLRELAARIEDSADRVADLDVADSGNPVTGMRADARSAAEEIVYFAGLASHARGTTPTGAPDTVSYTVREPYGVVARIVPFNHPFKFAAAKVAAPLAAGNAVVLKPGEQTSLSALELARMAEDLLPPGLLNVVTGTGSSAGRALVAHPGVPRVAFTGSVPSGRAVLREAAEHIKHVSVELGGKNPLVVLPDVDPVRAARATVAGMNIARCTGQSCGSTSRIFVHRQVRQQFLDALVARVQELRIGDPRDESTDVGPLSFRAHHERVTAYIESGLREGATLLTGGGCPAGLERGFFVEPTVFTDVEDDMTIARGEIFGPVMTVFSWSDVDEVVRRANALPLGLTANVWTNDVSSAHRMARDLEAGYVFVNGTGRRPLGAPFGGWKASGVGKENSLEELLSYTREKTVTVTLL